MPCLSVSWAAVAISTFQFSTQIRISIRAAGLRLRPVVPNRRHKAGGSPSSRLRLAIAKRHQEGCTMVAWLLPLVVLVAGQAPAPLPVGAAKTEVEVGDLKLQLF